MSRNEGNRGKSQRVRQIGQRIGKARRLFGLSQKAAAELMQWSLSKWGQAERGVVRISDYEIKLLSDLFRVPLSYFYSLDETVAVNEDGRLAQYRKDIGKRIQQVRKARGKTQAALAQAIGCSLVKLSRLEHGSAELSAYQLERLALFLNLSVDDLFSLSPDWCKPTQEDIAKEA